MGDLRKRFPIFFAFAARLYGISERDDSYHVQIVRYAEEWLHVVQSREANPIRSDSFGPCGQHHGLNRAGGIRRREFCLLNGDDNDQRRLRNVWTGARDRSQSAYRVALIDDDEMPGLAVHPAAG